MARSDSGTHGGSPDGKSPPAGDVPLEDKLTALQRKAALGQVVAHIVHELGVPLTTIGGHVDELLADIYSGKRRITVGDLARDIFYGI